MMEDVQNAEIISHSLQRLWTKRLGAIPIHMHEIRDEILDRGQCASSFDVQATDGELLEDLKPRDEIHYGEKELADTSDSDKVNVSSKFSSSQTVNSNSDQSVKEIPLVHLDGAELNDFPARYSVPALQTYEFAAVGIWIHPNIVPGFKYKVRPIEAKERTRFLFDNRALELMSIGRGYSRRLTFEASPGLLNNNENYFWTDSMPSGYAFQIHVVSAGDIFTAYDANNVAVASIEVMKVQNAQKEVKHQIVANGDVKKSVEVSMLCKVDWFYKESTSLVPITGIAVAYKQQRKSAKLIKILDAAIGVTPCRGYTLVPGVDDKQRQLTLNGCSVGDAPTVYIMTGLEPYELPVIGTYIDKRIISGFHYKVHPIGHKNYFFEGNALQLVNIGMGYGKRMSFKPDKHSLNNNANFFWSDSYPEGFGFQPQAVFCGMEFDVMDATHCIGKAVVFRSDNPQIELNQCFEPSPNSRVTVIKFIHVDVTCQIMLKSDKSDMDSQCIQVSGTAVAAKYPDQREAKLLCIENVGFSSKLNLVFMNQKSNIIFQAK